jgi:hypothetical protein
MKFRTLLITCAISGFTTANSFSQNTKGIKATEAKQGETNDLIFFSSISNGPYVKLEWTTARETNNDYFTIERSENGKEFEEIMVVRGAGHSSTPLNYSIEDKDPLKGTAYYRLKQTGFNGENTNFNMVVLNAGTGSYLQIRQAAYPNPFIDDFNIDFTLYEEGKVIATLIDMQGRLISRNIFTAEKGNNQFCFEQGSKLPAGIYFVFMEVKGQVESTKIIKS